jgi:predicted cupin superfamily sugar epimerase
MNPCAKYWIKELNLIKHPEGGYYKRTYYSLSTMATNFSLSNNNDNIRPSMTAIYYLIEQNNFSSFHRLKSDEIWHFYTGDSISIYIIDEQGRLDTIILGNRENDNRAVFQTIVDANKWFAVGLYDESKEGAFALVGCTVTPGFDFRDFEIANKEELIKQYPQHSNIINNFTR